MKTLEEIQKLTTSRLLRYYKAERNRMFNRGFRYIVIDEDEIGNEILGWDYTSARSYWGGCNLTATEASKQIDYISTIKKELDSRENISKDE